MNTETAKPPFCVNLDKRAKLHTLFPHPKERRGTLECAALLKYNSQQVAVATNGKAMAVVPFALTGSETGEMPGACVVLREEWDLARKNQEGDYLVFTEQTTASEPAPGRKFPNVTQIIPAKQDYKQVVHLDPKLLWDLAQAMGCERGVTLSVKDSVSAIYVDPLTNSCAMHNGEFVKYTPIKGSVGIIMPIYKQT